MGDSKITHNLHNSEDKNLEEHQNEEAEQQELHQEEEVVLVLVEEAEAEEEEEEEEQEEEEETEEEQEEQEEEITEEEEEVEREEALSLCDFPLSKEDQNSVIATIETTSKRTVRSSSESSDLFEFFSPDLSSECICSAEDIIFAGKLIPLNEQHLNSSSIHSAIPEQTAWRKRSESLPSSVSRSNSAKFKLVRTSYSLDDRKVQRPSNSLSPPQEQSSGTERNLLVKSDAVVNKKVGKPRWYVLMFGMVKFPAEMELNDIKSRQFRLNPLKKIPATSGAGGGSGSWKILKALSCKDHASVQVTTSFYVPAA